MAVLSLPQSSPNGPLTLVLYGRSAVADRAVSEAERELLKLGIDYEIIVLHGDDPPPQSTDPNVRFVSCADPTNYSAALHTACSLAEHPLVAVSDGSVDLSSLAYLIPLARRYPVVWGQGTERRGSFFCSLLAAGYHMLARTLLRTGMRDGNGGARMSLFQREALAAVLPESQGCFAPAEVLARAGRQGFQVAEAAVPVAPRMPGTRRRIGCLSVLRAVAECLPFWWSGVEFAAPEPQPSSWRSWLPGVVLAVLAALVLFPNLDDPLLDPDEGRQAEVPLEMLNRGDLLVPYSQGLPYYEKPPLQYWLTAGVYTLFGPRNCCARMVPAIAAWLVVVLSFAWGRRVLGPRPAFLGGLVLCLTPAFAFLGRTVLLDSLLAACVVGSWYTGHLAVRGPQLRWFWWLVSALVCGLGILTKGPVALVLFVVPVFAFTRLTTGAARPRWWCWVLYGAAAVSLAAPWYVAMALHEPQYLERFLWRANVMRFAQPYDHQEPWWFYVPLLFVGTFPWSLLWVWLGYFLSSRGPRLASRRPPALGFCLLAAGWVLFFYSLSGCKSPPYLAPLMAPLALLVGAGLETILFPPAGTRDAWLRFARQALPAYAAATMLWVSAACYIGAALLDWQPWSLILVAKIALTIGVVFAWWPVRRRARPAVAWAVCSLATLAFITSAVVDVRAGFAGRHSPQVIARLVRHWPGGEKYAVVTYGRDYPSASFYMRRSLTAVFDRGRLYALLTFLSSQREVLVLVDNGPPLDEMVAVLPPYLQPEIHRPQRPGQAALVVVRNTSPIPSPTLLAQAYAPPPPRLLPHRKVRRHNRGV